MRWLVIVAILMITTVSWAGDSGPTFLAPSQSNQYIQINPDGSLSWTESTSLNVQWIKDEKGKFKYLEVKGKNIHLRIYECGKVEKLEWKEINKNEEGPSFNGIRISPGSDNFLLPLPYYSR